MTLNARSAAPSDLVARHVGDFLDSQLSPNTRSSYNTDLAVFFAWLAGQGMDPLQAQRPHIDRFRNYLTELVDPDGRPAASGRPRFAPATVARRLSSVRAFYGYLVDRGVMGASPAVGVKSPRVMREPRGKALTEDQMRALLSEAETEGRDAEAIVCLLGLNGLRVSEVYGADVEDLRREPGGGHSLRVRGKGGKESWIPLNERTERAVLKCVAGRRSGPLVRRPADRRRKRSDTSAAAAPLRPWTQRSIWDLLMDLGGRAGLLSEELGDTETIHPHRLRHGFVTMLLDQGVPLPAVQDAARHSSADTTRLYDRARNSFREHPTHRLTFE